MTDQVLTLRIRTDASGTVQVVDSVSRSLDEMGERGARGGAQAARGIDDTSEAARKGRSSVDDYVRTLLTIGTIKVAGQLVEEFNAADSRLQRALGPLADFEAAQDRALQIAIDTGQAYAATAALGGNLSTSLRDIGIDGLEAAQRALGVAETVNQAIALGGGNAAGNEAAIQQLNQALSSGVLRGEELASVLEQTPRLAQAIADGLGVTRGELKGLAEDNVLTSAKVIEALESQAGALKKEFESLPPSISRSFTGLVNSTGRFLTDLDKSVGLTRLLAGGLDLLGDAIGPVLLGVTAVVAVRLAPWLLGVVTAATGATTVLGGLGAVLLRVVGGIPGLLIGAGVALTTWVAQAVSGSDAVAGGLDKLEERYDALINKQKELANSTPEAVAAQSANVLAESEAQLRDYETRIVALRERIGDADLTQFQPGLAPLINSLNVLEGAAGALAEQIEDVKAKAPLAQAALRELGGEADALSKRFDQAAAKLAGAFDEGITGLREKLMELRGIDPLESQANAAAGLNELLGVFGVELPDAITKSARSYLDLKKQVDAQTKSNEAAKKAEDLVADALRKGAAAADAKSDELDKLKAASAAAAEARDTERLDEDTRALFRNAEILRDVVEGLDEYAASIEEETALIGLSAEQRRVLEDQFTVEAIKRRELKRLTEDGNLSIAEEIALTESLAQISARLSEQRAKQSAEDANRTREVEDLGIELSDAFGRASTEILFNFDNIGDAFDDLGDSLINTAKRSASQILSEMFRLNAVNPLLNSIFGTNLQTGGGGGIGGLFSNLFASSGAPGGGRGSSFVGPPAPGGGLNFGGAVGAIGSAYGVYQAARSGSPLSGAASGAYLGAQIGSIVPVIGTAIGAVVGAIAGALAGILGGPKPPDLRLGAAGQTRKPEQTFETEFGTLQLGARGLEGGENDFKKPVQEFDATIAGIVRSFAAGQDQLDLVRTRLSTWAVDLKGDAISVEAVLGSRFNAILSTFSQDIQDFVGTTGEVAERAQRLADAAFLEGAAAAGDLLPTFGALARVLKEQQAEGEALSDTYARVLGSTQLLQGATELMGVSIAGGREAFIAFATEVADAAGGLDQARGLFADYFAFFYSEQERAIAQLRELQTNAADQLTGLGLDVNIDPAEFRQRFEDLLPTLSPEQIAEWLEAARALSQAEQAQAAYNVALRDGATSYATAAASVSEELALFDASDYVRSIAAIRTQDRERVAELNRLARAAGLTAAAEDDLADVTQLTARRMAQAAEELENRLRNAVSRLAQASLDARIRELETAAQNSADALGGFASGLSDVGQAASDALAQQINSMKTLQQYLDGEQLGDTSTLDPGQRLDEARAQFEALAVLARQGDADAQARLAQLADVLLRQGVSVLGGSTDQYQDLRDFVRGTIQGIVDAGPVGGTGGPVGSGGPGGAGGSGIVGGAVSPELQALYTERDRALAEQTARERLALAQEVAGYVRELVQGVGLPLEAIADRVGLSFEDLVANLGVNLDDMTAATVTQLADVSNLLGVELRDLTQQLNLDLGSLADRQSLLNQGLRSELETLPADQRAQLEPLLTAVETAVGEADANAAIDALTAVAGGLGPDVAEALAPYLEGLDPPDVLDELDHLTSIDDRVQAILDAITQPTPRDPTIPEIEAPVPNVNGAGNTPQGPLPVEQPIYVIPQPDPEERSDRIKSVAAAQATSQGVDDLRRETAIFMQQLVAAVQAGTATGTDAVAVNTDRVVNALAEVSRLLAEERRGA